MTKKQWTIEFIITVMAIYGSSFVFWELSMIEPTWYTFPTIVLMTGTALFVIVGFIYNTVSACTEGFKKGE